MDEPNSEAVEPPKTTEEVSEVENFLEDIAEKEGEIVPEKESPKEEEETPAEEQKTEEETPLHKIPRFKQLVREKNEYKAKVEEITSELKEIKEQLKSGDNSKDINVPDWLKDLFGDNPDHYKNFSNYQQGLINDIVNLIRNQQTEEQKREQDEVDKWRRWINIQFDELRDEGEKFNEKEVREIALKFQPIDEEGRVDIRKAYEIWSDKQELKRLKEKDPQKSDAKKKIAAQTSGKGAAPSDLQVQTAETLKGKSMHDLI